MAKRKHVHHFTERQAAPFPPWLHCFECGESREMPEHADDEITFSFQGEPEQRWKWSTLRALIDEGLVVVR